MSDSESDFAPEAPSKQEKRSKSEHKSSKGDKKSAPSPEKVKRGKTVKVDKKQKPPKGNEKQPKKKKQSKPKQAGMDGIKQLVYDYMQKQNRPYNVLNVFDNLHGKIKKPILQTVLNELSEQSKLSFKDFGKNRVYFLNQDSMDISQEEVNELARTSNELKENEMELLNLYKGKLEELKRLMARKTIDELTKSIDQTQNNLESLEYKKEKLTNVSAEKVDEKEVEAIEKEENVLRKQLKKRRRLTKQCLKTWSQILQKKVDQVAEMMGVQL